MNGVWHLLRAPWAVKRRGTEALYEVVRAMIVVRRSSFKDACRQLGDQQADLEPPDVPLAPEQRPDARRVGGTVTRVANILGGPDTCFVQSIAAHRMLERRGVPTFTVIGLAVHDGKRLRSHAWVHAGRQVVTGAGARRGFHPALAFSTTEIGQVDRARPARDARR